MKDLKDIKSEAAILKRKQAAKDSENDVKAMGLLQDFLKDNRVVVISSIEDKISKEMADGKKHMEFFLWNYVKEFYQHNVPIKDSDLQHAFESLLAETLIKDFKAKGYRFTYYKRDANSYCSLHIYWNFPIYLLHKVVFAFSP